MYNVGLVLFFFCSHQEGGSPQCNTWFSASVALCALTTQTTLLASRHGREEMETSLAFVRSRMRSFRASAWGTHTHTPDHAPFGRLPAFSPRCTGDDDVLTSRFFFVAVRERVPTRHSARDHSRGRDHRGARGPQAAGELGRLPERREATSSAVPPPAPPTPRAFGILLKCAAYELWASRNFSLVLHLNPCTPSVSVS